MLKHLIRYEVKIFTKNKDFIIWNIVFPLAFVTFFFLALGSLINPDNTSWEAVRLGILPGDNQASLIQYLDRIEGVEKTLEQMEEDNEDFLQYIILDNRQEAERLLSDDRLHGLVETEDTVRFTTTDVYTIYPNIMKQILQGYLLEVNTSQAILEAFREGEIPLSNADYNPGDLDEQSFAGIETSGRKEMISTNMVFFFAALAFVSFYPTMAGSVVVENTEANQSVRTMRKRLGPVTKSKIFFASLLPVLAFQLTLIVLVYFYIRLLGIDFGSHTIAILVLLFLSTFAAVFTGAAIAALTPRRPGVRTALVILIPLIFAFLNGMMVDVIFKLVSRYAPWIYQINPIGMVSQGLFLLKTEGVGRNYYMKLASLSIYVLVFITITLIGLRRSQYESI